MDRRGIVLENIVGIILAVAGAVLLSFMAAGIYAYIFPGITVGVEIENTLSDLTTHLYQWRHSSDVVEQTYIPFAMAPDRTLVMFGKSQPAALSGANQEIQRPPLRQCKERACACVYETKDCMSLHLERAGVLKCWELQGVDWVYFPKTREMHTNPLTPPIFGRSAFGDVLAQKEQELGRSIPFFVSQTVGSGLSFPSEYKTLFGSLSQTEFHLGGHGVGMAQPILAGGCSSLPRGDMAAHESMYMERLLLPGGESVLFLTPSFDPTLPARKQVLDNYERTRAR